MKKTFMKVGKWSIISILRC